MQSSEDTIRSLADAIKRSDHKQIHQLSKVLLKDKPDDVEYQQCYILSSLKLSQGQMLAQQHFKHPPTHEALQQLYAYYLYDRGDFQKTIQYINSLKNNSSLRLLLAQAHFRAFNYDKSAELMLNILKDSNLMQEQREEYIINLMATGLNRTLSAEVVKQFEKAIISAERKELLYNYSLVMFECQEYQKCLGYLKDFEGSLAEGKDANDLATVRLFRDFVEWSINKNVEKGINDTYDSMLGRVTNKNVRGVIHNNQIFFRQGQTIEHTHQVLRMFDECLQSQFKMTKRQRNVIHLNKLSLLLKKGRFPEAQKLMKEIETKEDIIRDSEFIKNRYYLLKKCKDPDTQAYIKQVGSFNSELAYCLRADLQKEKGLETELIADLKTKGKEATHPIIKNFIFSLLIKHSSLFEQYNDYLSEMAELTTDSNILQILLNIYENKEDKEKQQFILLRLLKLSPKNLQAKVKLAKLYLESNNVSQAQQVLRGIEGPEELGDIGYLQFIEKNIHVSIKKDEDIKEDIKQQTVSKKRIKKKKRVRLPKGVEKATEGFKPDPERWLPKWQRKGYKKKGKKGAGKTQGLATVGREETKNVFTAGTSTSNREVTRDAQKKKK